MIHFRHDWQLLWIMDCTTLDYLSQYSLVTQIISWTRAHHAHGGPWTKLCTFSINILTKSTKYVNFMYINLD